MSSEPSNTSRIFLGNLPSEKTSKEELHQIFSKYGNIVEDIVLRKSFGFIQFDTAEAALEAIKGEQGRIIGGMKLDLNLADNRNKKKNDERRERSRRDREDRRDAPYKRPPSPDRRKRRSISPPREDRNRNRIPMSQGPALCLIIHIGRQSEGYARELKDLLSRQFSFGIEIQFAEYRAVPEATTAAEKRGYRYLLIVGRHSEQKRTLTLHVFRAAGNPEVHTDIPMDQSPVFIRREEELLTSTMRSMQPSMQMGVLPTAWQMSMPSLQPQIPSMVTPQNAQAMQAAQTAALLSLYGQQLNTTAQLNPTQTAVPQQANTTSFDFLQSLLSKLSETTSQFGTQSSQSSTTMSPTSASNLLSQPTQSLMSGMLAFNPLSSALSQQTQTLQQATTLGQPNLANTNVLQSLPFTIPQGRTPTASYGSYLQSDQDKAQTQRYSNVQYQ